MVSARTWRRSIAAAALFLPLAMAAAPVASAQDGGSSTPSSSPTTGYQGTTPPSLAGVISNPVCDGNVPYLGYDIDVDGDKSATAFDLTWTSLDGQHTATETKIPGKLVSVHGESHFVGKILWLGATESGGQATGWPGWIFKNGTWNEGGPYTWVRPSVNVSFSVNGTAGNVAASSDATVVDGVFLAGTAQTDTSALVLPADATVSAQANYPPATKACADPMGATPSPSSGPTVSSSSSPTATTAVAAITVTHQNGLAVTGMNALPFIAAALLLLLIGGVLILVSRRHRKAPQTY